jgi:hypothetical protein
MVHGRQWGVKHDIPVKMTHVTTEEEMKEDRVGRGSQKIYRYAVAVNARF